MKTTVNINLTITASEEAKICLTCDKPKCSPDRCERFKLSKEKLKEKLTKGVIK